jgi:CRP/FNR family transcriptional regulator
VLEACSVIQSLDRRSKTKLLDRAVPKQLDAGEFLFLTGESAERVHVLTDGLIKFSTCDDEGRETALGIAVPGDLVGDLSVIDGLGQPFDAVTVTVSTVVGLDAELFLEVVERSARASIEWARTIAARNRWLAGMAQERGSQVVTARLAGRLLDLAELVGRMCGGTIEIDIPLGQTDLGKLAGMSRESACRGMRALQREGVLTYEKEKLRIFRPDALARIRCAGRGAVPCR